MTKKFANFAKLFSVFDFAAVANFYVGVLLLFAFLLHWKFYYSIGVMSNLVKVKMGARLEGNKAN